MNFKAILLLMLIAIFSACGSAASKLYNPTEVNAAKANVSVDNLLEGKVLYMNKCNKCHGLKKPSKYSAEKWTDNLNKMQERAKITDAEKKRIHTYLTSEVME